MAEYNFSLHEIAEMAVGVEEAGAKFYKALAANTTGKTAEVFAVLSEQETVHREFFRELAEKFHGESAEYAIDIVSMLRDCVDRLKNAAFDIGSAGSASSIPQALQVAIRTEQESIRSFSHIRGSFTETFHAVLDNIISEEKRHLAILTDLWFKASA